MTLFNDHEFFKDKLSAYFDQELKNVELAIVQEHIDSCPECQQVLAELEKFDQMVEANSQLSGDDYWEKSAQKIESAISEPIETIITPVESKPMTGLWWKLTAAAASIAIIAFVAMYEKDITDYNFYNGQELPDVVPVDTFEKTKSDSIYVRGGRTEPATVNLAAESFDSGLVVETVKDLDQSIKVTADEITDKFAKQGTPAEQDRPATQDKPAMKDTVPSKVTSSEVKLPEAVEFYNNGIAISNGILPQKNNLVEQLKETVSEDALDDEIAVFERTVQKKERQASEESVKSMITSDTVSPKPTPVKKQVVSEETKQTEVDSPVEKIRETVDKKTVAEIDGVQLETISVPAPAYRSNKTDHLGVSIEVKTTDSSKNVTALKSWQAKLKKLTDEIENKPAKKKRTISKSFSGKSKRDNNKTALESPPVSTEMTLKLMECHYHIARLAGDTVTYNNSYKYLLDQSWVENKNIRVKAEKYLKLLDSKD